MKKINFDVSKIRVEAPKFNPIKKITEKVKARKKKEKEDSQFRLPKESRYVFGCDPGVPRNNVAVYDKYTHTIVCDMSSAKKSSRAIMEELYKFYKKKEVVISDQLNDRLNEERRRSQKNGHNDTGIQAIGSVGDTDE